VRTLLDVGLEPAGVAVAVQRRDSLQFALLLVLLARHDVLDKADDEVEGGSFGFRFVVSFGISDSACADRRIHCQPAKQVSATSRSGD
jgi:hypothetical protein